MTPHIDWSDTEIELISQRIKAVAQPYRLGIVCLLLAGERSVGEICQALDTSQPNISQHLTQLTNRGLLKSRKDANKVYYSITDRNLALIVGMLQEIYCP